MVAAYLRGLLKPSLNYGLRSSVAESYVFDMLMADTQARGLETSALTSAAILPAMTQEGKHNTMRAIQKRIQRCAEIRNGDVYRVGKIPVSKSNGISMYQLYQLCVKAGIMDQLAGVKPA